MDFLVDIEKTLANRRMPLKHFALLCIFWIMVPACVVYTVFSENYISSLSILISALVCYLFYKEIKKLHGNNQITLFQKNIATSGFDASIFAFFVFSDTGRCVFINRAAQNLFPGFRLRTIEDFIVCFGKYPKVIEAINQLQLSVKNRKSSHVDVPMNLHSDNTALWRISVAALPDHKGFSAWSIVDLTPSKAQIISLETNSSFLLNIINTSCFACFCVDEHDEILFCNNAFSYWTGLKTDNLLHNNFYSYVVKDTSDRLPHERLNDKLSPTLPSKIILKSEISGTVEVIVTQLFSTKDGVRVYMATKDSQQSVDLIQELGKTKLYFEHIFEDAPVGILITDGDEMISTYNGTFKRIVGAGDDALQNTSFLDYVQPEEKENIREKLYHLLSEVYRSIAPFEIQFKSKKDRTVMVYVSKIEESKRYRETDGLVFYFIDITERKELQHQFVQSQKMQAVGQLAGGIAHDFNNLLTAMIGYCDLLLEKYLPSDQSFNDIMQIKQNANRASNLVRQLLAFSRQQTLQPKVLNVTDMLGELSVLLRRLLGAKVELQVVHDRNVGYIKVDQIQFEQVVINLAVNARDAMSDGGTLTIRTLSYKSNESKFSRGDTMPPGEYVLIEVADSGTGIAESHLNRIFDPFFSTKEKGHGTGLGLSTVYGIVNQTGGFISVESEMGVGTKFSLYFPMYAASDCAESTQKDTVNERSLVDLTGVGTILLVEDEDAVRMFSSRALRDKGYRVIEASNGESALEFIKTDGDTIDLVITDVVMPKMDGPTLMEHIKSTNPKMKVIFISGYTEDSFRKSLANDAKVHFLSKPFNLRELALKVKEVIG